MAFLIDQLNNSGLFAQSAYSAGIATCDSDGNVITATYLTGVDLSPYQTTAGMTAYATTGDVANKLDTTAFNIPESANWNNVYDTVQTNSGSWTGGGGGSIDTIPFIVQSPLTTGISGYSAYIGIDGEAFESSAYVPFSALTDNYMYDGYVHMINGSGVYAVDASHSNYSDYATYDNNGNSLTDTTYYATEAYNTVQSNSANWGGGGPATSMINSGFTASGYVSGYRPFTATQNVVPLYDIISGTCVSGSVNQMKFIQVPMSALSGANDLFNYNLNFNFQSWDIEHRQDILIFPSSADVYTTQYKTNKRTDDFEQDIGLQPTLYYLDFSQADFISYWSGIQAQPWVATAFTGEYVYIGFPGYQNFQNMKGDWAYKVQTGTDIPYPSYPTTTTGYITNYISGREFFVIINPFPSFARYEARIGHSGYKNIVYDNSPEGGSESFAMGEYSINAFSSNMLKNNLTAKTNYNVGSPSYSYNYGTTQTAYSGFEGI